MQVAKEIHLRVIRSSHKQKIITRGIDDLWAADLLIMHDYSCQNKGYKYILNVIDTFSKYMFLQPLKKKTGQEVAGAFEKILKQYKRTPNLLHVDKGKEFVNKYFKTMLKKHNIVMYHTQNLEKSAIAERANRTINEKLKLHFSVQNNRKWLDLLPTITDEYNNKDVHRTIGMPPAKVNKENEMEILQRLYNVCAYHPENPKFKIGDRVRISVHKTMFDNKYTPNWTEERFLVTKVFHTDPPTYSVKDEEGELIEGKFYKQELLLSKV